MPVQRYCTVLSYILYHAVRTGQQQPFNHITSSTSTPTLSPSLRSFFRAEPIIIIIILIHCSPLTWSLVPGPEPIPSLFRLPCCWSASPIHHPSTISICCWTSIAATSSPLRNLNSSLVLLQDEDRNAVNTTSIVGHRAVRNERNTRANIGVGLPRWLTAHTVRSTACPVVPVLVLTTVRELFVPQRLLTYFPPPLLGPLFRPASCHISACARRCLTVLDFTRSRQYRFRARFCPIIKRAVVLLAVQYVPDQFAPRPDCIKHTYTVLVRTGRYQTDHTIPSHTYHTITIPDQTILSYPILSHPIPNH